MNKKRNIHMIIKVEGFSVRDSDLDDLLDRLKSVGLRGCTARLLSNKLDYNQEIRVDIPLLINFPPLVWIREKFRLHSPDRIEFHKSITSVTWKDKKGKVIR